MLGVHTILHPTDFSDNSKAAFGIACALARDYGARLIVLHVAPIPAVVYGEGIVPPEPESQLEILHEELEKLHVPQDNIRAERRLEEGNAVSQILRVARETHTDLIVMGTHGRTGLARLLMGSVAEEMVRRAPCPVLTVRSPFPVDEPELSHTLAEPAHV